MSLSFWINVIAFSIVVVVLLSLHIRPESILLGWGIVAMAKLYEAKHD